MQSSDPARRGRPPKSLTTNQNGNGATTINTLPASTQSNIHNEFRTSNLTTSHFLGTKERSWMRGGAENLPLSSTLPYAARLNMITAPARDQAHTAPQGAQTVYSPQDTVSRSRGIAGGQLTSLGRNVVGESAGAHATGQNTHFSNHFVSTSVPEGVDLTIPSQQQPTLQESQTQSSASLVVPNQYKDTGNPIPQHHPIHLQPSTNLVDQSTPSLVGSVHQQSMPSLANVSISSSAFAPIDMSQQRGNVDLNGFSMPLPINTTATNVPRQPSQLLTPVASPEQALQHLHRKRSSNSVQLSTSTSEPPHSRRRSEAFENGYVPSQSIVSHPVQVSHQGHIAPVWHQPTSSHSPIDQSDPNSLRRQPSLSRVSTNTFTTLGVSNNPSPSHSASNSRSTTRRHPSQPSLTAQSRGRSYLAVLQTTCQDLRQRVSFTYTAENLRLPWLTDACETGDLTFLLLNQILCATTLDPRLSQHLEFKENHIAGMQIMQLFFGPNTNMPIQLVEFLAGWPNSLYSLKTSPELKSWIDFISLSLELFGKEWEYFRRQCLQRCTPPGAREITHRFKCGFSSTLPRAIFSSLARQVTDSEAHLQKRSPKIETFHVEAFDLFVEDQRNYNILLSSSTALPPLEGAKKAFKNSYLNLYQRHFINPVPQQTQRPTTGVLPNANNTPESNAQSIVLSTLAQPDNGAGINATIHNTPNTMNGQGYPNTNSSRGTQSQQQSRLHTLPAPTQIPVASLISTQLPPMINGDSVSQRGVSNPRYLHGTISSQPPNGLENDANRGPMRQGSTPVQIVPPLPNQSVHMPRRISEQLPTAESPDIPLFPSGPYQNPLLANPIPQQEAIHQAHLHEPTTVLSKNLSKTTDRMYQFIEQLIFGPRTFTSTEVFFTENFDVSNDLHSRIAQTQRSDHDALEAPKRTIDNYSIIFHLRCVQVPSTSGSIKSELWAALPTYWPEHVFIAINDEHLEFRRKRQYKRDLQVDITNFIQKGRNKIIVSFYPEAQDLNRVYAVGCEAVTFRDSALVSRMPEQLSKEDSLKQILQAMRPVASEDDDDMQIVTDSLTISIADPFSASLLKTPVKGRRCLHRECFSLETFYESRTSDNGDALTSVSQWLCPHCKRDARPCSLVIDGFLQEVCRHLFATGCTDAKAIILKADGFWTVRKEDDSNNLTRPGKGLLNVSDSKTNTSNPCEASLRENFKTGDNTRTLQPAVVEIVDLDSY